MGLTADPYYSAGGKFQPATGDLALRNCAEFSREKWELACWYNPAERLAVARVPVEPRGRGSAERAGENCFVATQPESGPE